MKERVLLIDTCGDPAGVCLCEGERLILIEELARGAASASIVAAVRRLLKQTGWVLGDLDAIGVVSGPGSFTGVRVGLATAKGLCEGAGLRLVAVSRFEVLAHAAGLTDGFAVLDAGRNEFYVRDVRSGGEWLLRSGLDGLGAGTVSVAELRVAESLSGRTIVVRELSVADAAGVVLRRLRTELPTDAVLVDANYVRGESDIYRKQGAVTPRAGS